MPARSSGSDKGILDSRRDDLFSLDDPPAAAWFETALDVGWTRDPSDRLTSRRPGCVRRLATADQLLASKMSTKQILAL